MTAEPMPSYGKPPVIEVVIGAQFKTTEQIQAAHVGLFWSRVRGEYPKTETAAPLPPYIEGELRPAPTEPSLNLLPATALPRTYFVDASDVWLMQLQADRFVHNWRRKQDDYPRFPEVLKRFEDGWAEFRRFCTDEAIGEPTVSQLEVTYINHIPAGEGWDHLGQLNNVFRDFTWRDDRRFLPSPELVTWRAAFPFPDQLGRLHVSTRLGFRKSDSAKVLICEMSGRGAPKDGSQSAMIQWIHMAREWAVKGFADLVAETIQSKQWERQQ